MIKLMCYEEFSVYRDLTIKCILACHGVTRESFESKHSRGSAARARIEAVYVLKELTLWPVTSIYFDLFKTINRPSRYYGYKGMSEDRLVKLTNLIEELKCNGKVRLVTQHNKEEAVIDMACEYFGVSKTKLLACSRDNVYPIVRAVLYFIFRERFPHISNEHISVRLGYRRGHTYPSRMNRMYRNSSAIRQSLDLFREHLHTKNVGKTK